MITAAFTIAGVAFSSAAGWLPSGHRWRAADLPVPYCITANGTNTNLTANQQRNAITAAINSWVSGGLSCTLYTASAMPSATCNPVQDSNDGQNNFFWQNNWQLGSQTIGVTWSVFFGNCGNVTDDQGVNHALDCSEDSDIELNDVDYFWDNTGADTDVQSIAAHEYGHFIGLGHCNDNNTCMFTSAIMYAAYGGGTMRTPFNDDVQGACALYPGTQGDLGWPCAGTADCSLAPICVNPGASGYCTETCGTCPTGYLCAPNPQNAAQTVCLRDDGLNRGLCEVCVGNVPDACRDGGLCFSGLPEATLGRCTMLCPDTSMPRGGCPNQYDCYQVSLSGGGTEDHCFPLSSDCTNLGNFTELQIGQNCNANSPPCAQGLDCIGICSPPCTGGPGPGNCPAGYACETFQFQSGPQSYCAPPVAEGRNCSGVVACPTGPCLLVSGNEICFKSCAGDPGACNNAQTCNTRPVPGGGSVAICEPPGVPPRIDDASVPIDLGSPDLGCGCDFNPGECDPGCSCDLLCTEDAGVIIEEDASTQPIPDGAVVGGPDANGGGNLCQCDVTYSCDLGCEDCDPECRCPCDETTACDGRCPCDPECEEESSCACSSTEHRAPFTAAAFAFLTFLLGGLALLGFRRLV